MTPAAPAPLAGRALWRRYRAPLIAAIPAGVALGAIADLAFSMQTVHASPQDRLPALAAYALVGAGFALVASIGAVVAVLTGRPPAAAGATLRRIAAGAGGAVGIGVLVVGILSALLTGSWEWYAAVAVLAVVTGLIAGASAAVITALLPPRHRLLP